MTDPVNNNTVTTLLGTDRKLQLRPPDSSDVRKFDAAHARLLERAWEQMVFSEGTAPAGFTRPRSGSSTGSFGLGEPVIVFQGDNHPIEDALTDTQRSAEELERLNAEARRHRNTLALTRMVHSVPEDKIDEAERELKRIELEINATIAAMPDSAREQIVNGLTGEPYTEVEWNTATMNALAERANVHRATGTSVSPAAVGWQDSPESVDQALALLNEEIGQLLLETPDGAFDSVINWRTQAPYTEQAWQVDKIEALSREELRLTELSVPGAPGFELHANEVADVRLELSTRLGELPAGSPLPIINASTGKAFTPQGILNARLIRPGIVPLIAGALGDGDTEGAVDFGNALEERTRNMTPVQTAAVIESLVASGELETAIDSFNDEYEHYASPPTWIYPEQDEFIADLTAVVSAADDPVVAGQVAALLPEGRFLGSARQAIGDGHGVDLTVALVQRYAVSDSELSDLYVQEVLKPGVDLFVDNYDEIHATFLETEALFLYRDAQFGQNGTEAERRAAAADFYEIHGQDYQAYDAWSERAVELLSDTYNLETVDGELMVEPAAQFELLETLPAMVRTPSGNMALGDTLLDLASGEHTFLDLRFTEAFEARFDDAEALEDFQERVDYTLVNAATVGAAVAMEDGVLVDPEAYIDGLERSGALRDLGVTGAKRLLIGLKSLIASGRNGSRVATFANQTDFDNDLAALADRPLLASGVRASTIVLGGYAWWNAKDGFGSDSFEERALALNSTIGYGFGVAKEGTETGFAIWARNADDAVVLNKWNGVKPWVGGFSKVVQATGYVSLTFDIVSASDAFANGNFADAGFSMTSAVGSGLILYPSGIGWLGLSAGGVTALGTALVIGGAVAKMQYDNVKASNEHENEETERYIRHILAGSDNPEIDEVIRHLRNADSQGRNVGVLLRAVAKELEMEPHEFFDLVGELPPDTVLALVEAAHGVDPMEGENPLDVQSLPRFDPSDSQVGQRVRITDMGDYRLVGEDGMDIYVEGEGYVLLDRSTDPDLRRDYDTPIYNTFVVTPKSVTGWITYAEDVLGVLPP